MSGTDGDGAASADDAVSPGDDGGERPTPEDGGERPPGDDGGGRPPGDRGEKDEPHDSLLAALHVGEHARVGLAVGIGLAAVLYVPRYPVLDTSIEGARGYYLGLAFVLAATTAAVITAALSSKTFLEPVLDRSAWLRRGGVLCVLGGVGWASTPILAELADGGAVDPLLWRNAASLASLAVLFGTIGLHCAVKPGVTARGGRLRRVERGAYWIALVGLLIAAANATGNAAPTTTAGGETVATPFLIGVLLAAFAAIPFAATAELSGRLPRWRIRALQLGGLLATLGIAWLVPLGGADWLAWSDAPAALDGASVSVGLAATLVPAGLGWAIAGAGLWTAARAADGATPVADGAPAPADDAAAPAAGASAPADDASAPGNDSRSAREGSAIEPSGDGTGSVPEQSTAESTPESGEE